MTVPDTTTTFTSASPVHWTQPGLAALTETDGHGDTCGPIVLLDYRHLAHGVPLDVTTLDAARAELIRWGLMDAPGLPGMTIQQLAAALSQHYQVEPIKVVGYGGDMSAFHNELERLGDTHQLVIVLHTDAAKLPDNQPGVANHFTLIGGIDSTEGYWTCNGDTETALRSGGVTSPVWYTWAQLEASQPAGYILLPALDPPATTPPPPSAPPAAEVTITGAPGGPEPVVTLAGNRWQVVL